MKALVLSAGLGERLRPLTNTIPKPLLEVGGRPLIEYALLMVKSAGITEVAINVHHLAQQIEHALGNGESLGLSINYSPEPHLMGTGGPLLALRDYFANEPFLILNSDTIIDLDVTHLIASHREHGGLATLVLRSNRNLDTYSRIEIDSSARIRRMRLLKARPRGEFDDYPPDLDPAIAVSSKPYMYCGVMVCEPAALTALPQAVPFSLVGSVLAPRLAQGSPLFGYVHDRFFRTVDDLKSYWALRDEFTATPPPLAYLRAD
jgi:mannose-1-phosphate guanylyltransferase